MPLRRILTKRELQAYAAACLVEYARALGIRSPSLDKLVDHLLALLVATDLPEWEGGLDAVTEDWLERLRHRIPDELMGEVENLVWEVVEVGVHDMYAADTAGSLESAHMVLDALARRGVIPPTLEELFGADVEDRDAFPGAIPWGEPVPMNRFEIIRRWCRRTLGAGSISEQ